MANYLLKYKGRYRILPTFNESTHDLPREPNGAIEDGDIYIACQNGNKIFAYGHKDGKKTIWLTAYIPSLKRGHKIRSELDEKKIEYTDYLENDEEVFFDFRAQDIDSIASLLKAKTAGAGISPFSIKNFPLSNAEIPTEKIQEYKEITAKVKKSDLLIISNITDAFLKDILQRKQRHINKTYDYKADMKQKCMARQKKEFIFTMGYWDEYLKYLSKGIDAYYKTSV